MYIVQIKGKYVKCLGYIEALQVLRSVAQANPGKAVKLINNDGELIGTGEYNARKSVFKRTVYYKSDFVRDKPSYDVVFEKC